MPSNRIAIKLQKIVTDRGGLSPVWRNHLLFSVQLLVAFMGWRIALFLAGFLGQHRLRLGMDPAYVWISDTPWVPEGLSDTWAYFARWDAGWYLSIIEHGYGQDIPAHWSNLVFFPLYPFLSSIVHWFGVHPVVSLILVANIALFAALFMFWKLARLDISERASWTAIALLLLFPTAVFLGSAYTESLFLLCSLGTFYLARKQKWWGAGAIGILAVLTRPTGIFLIPALIVEYFEQRNWNIQKTRWDIFGTVLPAVGLLFYMVYLGITFGNPLLFLSGQQEWGRSGTFSLPEFSTLIGSYIHDLFFYAGDNLAYAIANSTDLLALFVGILLGILVTWRLRASYGIYILVSVLLAALTGSLHSLPRFLLVLFPMLILLARWSQKWPGFHIALLSLFAVLFAIFSLMVTNLWWVA